MSNGHKSKMPNMYEKLFFGCKPTSELTVEEACGRQPVTLRKMPKLTMQTESTVTSIPVDPSYPFARLRQKRDLS